VAPRKSGPRAADQFLIGSFGCCRHQNHCSRFPANTRGAILFPGPGPWPRPGPWPPAPGPWPPPLAPGPWPLAPGPNGPPSEACYTGISMLRVRFAPSPTGFFCT